MVPDSLIHQWLSVSDVLRKGLQGSALNVLAFSGSLTLLANMNSVTACSATTRAIEAMCMENKVFLVLLHDLQGYFQTSALLLLDSASLNADAAPANTGYLAAPCLCRSSQAYERRC